LSLAVATAALTRPERGADAGWGQLSPSLRHGRYPLTGSQPRILCAPGSELACPGLRLSAARRSSHKLCPALAGSFASAVPRATPDIRQRIQRTPVRPAVIQNLLKLRSRFRAFLQLQIRQTADVVRHRISALVLPCGFEQLNCLIPSGDSRCPGREHFLSIVRKHSICILSG
jgi:hypothetical protein